MPRAVGCVVWGQIIMSFAALVASAQTSQPLTGARADVVIRAATQPVLDAETDKILTRLEERTVRDLRAKLTWQQRYVQDAPDEAITKLGEIWYQDAQPVAKFIIRFDGQLSGTRKDPLDERHLFDGQWYVKVESQTKTVERHEVRKADDPANPYKIGEGTFPLPFGQKKRDILNEFVVERLDPGADAPTATDHLRLTPRPGTRTNEQYRTIDFWVAREGPLAGLPVRVRTARLDGTGSVDSYITINFSNVRLNEGFSSGVFELKDPPGYRVESHPLE